MCNRGWILRNTIIWHKPNCMPSSVRDRFTVDYEYVFFFVKNKKYWFEKQFEIFAESTLSDKPTRDRKVGSAFVDGTPGRSKQYGGKVVMPDLQGRNKRCVWTITTKPYKGAHFAVYPEKLIETPVKAGCPEFVCKKCGKAREKIYDRKVSFHSGSGKSGNIPKGKWEGGEQQISGNYDIRMGPRVDFKEKGYTKCKCNAGFSAGTVLDPFIGSGTTAVVAKKLNRNWLGIELNPDYIKLAEKRIANAQRTML